MEWMKRLARGKTTAYQKKQKKNNLGRPPFRSHRVERKDSVWGVKQSARGCF